MNRFDILIKRIFDVCLSFFGVLITFPIIISCWVVASVETKSNGFFFHERIGLNGRHFKIYKIKTMHNNDQKNTITSSNDERLTFSGKIFRKFKLDELPQLINILFGHMSFVGPRPDVKKYYDMTTDEHKIIYSIRPGLTGPASLKYKDEEFLLSKVNDPLSYNDDIIWPDKVTENIKYIKEYNFFKDIYYIIKTIF